MATEVGPEGPSPLEARVDYLESTMGRMLERVALLEQRIDEPPAKQVDEEHPAGRVSHPGLEADLLSPGDLRDGDDPVYELEDSAWNAAIFIGMPCLGPATSCALSFMLFLSVVGQIGFP